MRKCLFALVSLLLILFSANVFALNVSGANNVPANINWSFSVSFDSMDFWKTEVFLDGTSVLTAISDGSQLLTPFTENKQFLVSANFASNNLAVSMMGLNPGDHTLTVKTWNIDGSEKGNTENVFTVFEVLSGSFREETETSISNVESQVSSVSESMASVTASIDSLRGEISELNSSIQAKDATISELQSTISDLQSEVNSLKSTDQKTNNLLETITERIDVLKDDLNAQKTEFEEVTGSGFISFGKTSPMSLILILGVIVLIVLGAFAYRRYSEEGTLFNLPFGSDSPEAEASDEDAIEGADEEPEEGEEELDEKEVEEDEIEEKRGKWAFGDKSDSDSSEENKGFSVGDLIKKN